MERKCPHRNVELIGVEKAERDVNRYYRCLDCGCVLVLSEDKRLYVVPGLKGRKGKNI